jgi:6-phosphogluconolactonase
MKEKNILSHDWREHYPPTIEVYDTKKELMQGIADDFLELAAAAQQSGRSFSVLLGGGRTPVELNRCIVNSSGNRPFIVDWHRIHIWFSDERCVPPDHGDSNYRLIDDTLLRPLGIPQKNVTRLKGERSPEQAASDYHQQLSLWGARYEQRIPIFDLVLLGLGPDGHTASLFPGSEALRESRYFAVPAGPGPEGWHRVSVTLLVINSAENVWLMAAGAEKANAVKQLLDGGYDPLRYPAQGVIPVKGSLVYYFDALIAEQIGGKNGLEFRAREIPIGG